MTCDFLLLFKLCIFTNGLRVLLIRGIRREFILLPELIVAPFDIVESIPIGFLLMDDLLLLNEL